MVVVSVKLIHQVNILVYKLISIHLYRRFSCFFGDSVSFGVHDVSVGVKHGDLLDVDDRDWQSDPGLANYLRCLSFFGESFIIRRYIVIIGDV
jgi:hypothetical protein